MPWRDTGMIVTGFAVAWAGGELFLHGLLALSRRFRLSSFVAGAFLAAFATSAPEFAVGVVSAWREQTALSYGDVLGSNVINLGLIFGLTCILGCAAPSKPLPRSILFLALLQYPIFSALGWDGRFIRVEGLILLAVFTVYLRLLYLHRAEVGLPRMESADSAGLGFSIAMVAGGLLLLLGSSQLIVRGALGIASAWGVDAFLVGAFLVAFGTSIPELATALIACRRGHPEIGLGTLLGSNLFNGFAIVGTATLIGPFETPWRVWGVGVAAGLCVTLLTVLPVFKSRYALGIALWFLVAAYWGALWFQIR